MTLKPSKEQLRCILNASLYGVILNLILPFIFKDAQSVRCIYKEIL